MGVQPIQGRQCEAIEEIAELLGYEDVLKAFFGARWSYSGYDGLSSCVVTLENAPVGEVSEVVTLQGGPAASSARCASALPIASSFDCSVKGGLAARADCWSKTQHTLQANGTG